MALPTSYHNRYLYSSFITYSQGVARGDNMDILDALIAAKDTQRLAKDLTGKLTGIAIAPVYQVYPDDTVTVLLPSTGGRSPSPPLYRVLPTYQLTYPAVRPGDTVAYGFIEGNPNQGVYWGVLHNAVNPPLDLTQLTYNLGNTVTNQTQDSLSQYHSTTDDNSDASGTVITADGIKLDKKGTVGASITVTDGVITLKAGTLVITISQTGMTVSGGGAASLALSGLTSASINGNQMATIGAVDTHSDTLTTRGW